jgi:YidC/Oxa1 family membrane protein insertase
MIFWGWQKFYIEPQIKTAPPATALTSNASVGAISSAPALEVKQEKPQDKSKTQIQTVSTPAQTKELAIATGTARVSNGSKLIEAWSLNGYRTEISSQSKAIDLAGATLVADGEVSLDFEKTEFAYLTQVKGELTERAGEVTSSYSDQNIKLQKTVSVVPGQPYFNVLISGEFLKDPPKFAFVSLSGQSHESDIEVQDRRLVYWHQTEMGSELLSSPFEQKQISGPVKWIGVTNRYFLMALVDQSTLSPVGLLQPLAASGPITVEGKQVIPNAGRVSMVYPIQGSNFNIPLKVYFGPKELDSVRSVDTTLDHTIDFGWFSAVAYPLLRIMKWLQRGVSNWGIAIILLTLLVKVVLFPLTYKSMKSMKQMAKLQPQLQRIKEKYKDDKEALNREMLTLMKTHGYNPMAGCLPILIQMPIFFALYRVLYSSIELYHAPFYLWINDLSSKDPFYVTPVLLTAVMYIQQKLTPTTMADPAQQKMMQYMPIMFGVFMVTLPSGLTIYMLVNALASIVQQIYLNKKLDLRPTPVPAVK